MCDIIIVKKIYVHTVQKFQDSTLQSEPPLPSEAPQNTGAWEG